MFGETFQFTRPLLKAVPGEYNVILTDVRERNLKGYAVLTFTFEYEDKKARIPNTFDLFDVVDKTDPDQLRAFNLKASKIALCFGLKGSFSPECYEQWKGSTGRVLITRSENGFLNVTDFIDKAEYQESTF